MENTLGNKAKFFALYWGQSVRRLHSWSDKITSNLINDKITFTVKEEYLQLKPLSSISDEDAIEIQKLNPWADYREGQSDKQGYIEHAKSFLKEGQNILQSYSDYLRSKGYALPFMGISVDQMIDFGWIKLHGFNT